MICVVAPAIIIAIYTLVIDGIYSHHGSGRKTYTFKARLWELNCGILGLLLAVGASFVITGMGSARLEIWDMILIVT
jgi:diacylglycerol diphosphate phosphatase/phosphatidate phosphatase